MPQKNKPSPGKPDRKTPVEPGKEIIKIQPPPPETVVKPRRPSKRKPKATGD